MSVNKIPRPEYPRPQFARSEWLNLNGVWDFEIDNGVSGKERKMFADYTFNSKINVPFCPESELSGIGNKDFMNAVWYKRTFELPWKAGTGRTILNIGACDYRPTVWVNGTEVGRHYGGYVAFSFDITAALTDGTNTVVVCAEDDVRGGKQPRGKQSALYYSHGCDYTRTTGIWQTVWIEHVPSAYIKAAKMTPDTANSALYIEAECFDAHGKTVTASAFFGGKAVGTASAVVSGKFARMMLKVDELHLWSCDDPALYDLELKLEDDNVKSYFGMREVAYYDHKFFLNGKPLYQRLILDQGFYPDGIYTAPTEDELIGDIKRSMDMGFNGARLHQKVFEPLFLYHCDRLGYIVWDELGNWGLDLALPTAWKGYAEEWLEIMQRDYNHPSIVGWCPFNETQHNQDNDLLAYIYEMSRAYDNTRPVIDTSGWAHVITDMWDEHFYNQDPKELKERIDAKMEEQPDLCFISEYGGIWWNPQDTENGWGYGERPKTPEEFIERYRALTTVLLSDKRLCAFCYTQLTNIEQEVNGLYYYDRKPKFDPAIIREINTQKAAIEIE
nr:beta-galactosidase [Clostridia bacterium]